MNEPNASAATTTAAHPLDALIQFNRMLAADNRALTDQVTRLQEDSRARLMLTRIRRILLLGDEVSDQDVVDAVDELAARSGSRFMRFRGDVRQVTQHTDTKGLERVTRTIAEIELSGAAFGKMQPTVDVVVFIGDKS